MVNSGGGPQNSVPRNAHKRLAGIFRVFETKGTSLLTAHLGYIQST